MNLVEYIDYVRTIATQHGAEPDGSPILDAQMAVEVFLPAVLRQVSRTALRNDRYHSLMNQHTLTIASEVADLPAGVEEEFARTFQVGNTTNDLGVFTWYPSYFDYVASESDLFPRFTVRDRKLYATKLGGVADGSLTLYGLTVPQVPTTETADIPVGDEILDDCLTLSASLLRGQVPLTVIGL